MDILSLVCGACSCERNWSAFDFIHTKKRNKLSVAKAQDLVYVFSNLRLIRKLTAAGSTELFYAWADVESSAKETESLKTTVGSTARFPNTLAGKQFEGDVSSDEELEVCSKSDSDDENHESDDDECLR